MSSAPSSWASSVPRKAPGLSAQTSGEGAELAHADHDPHPVDRCLRRHVDASVLAGVLGIPLELARGTQIYC